MLTVALAALVPARPGLAQATSSTSSPAATTSTTAGVTTTSTTVQSTTTAPPLVVLPYDPLFPSSPDTSSVGPVVTGISIPATITTVVELPFSTPFSQATTTTRGVETIAVGSTTTEPATMTTTTTPTTSTAAPPPRLQLATVPAPAPASSEAGSGAGAWTVLACGVVLGAAALVAWRRLRGIER